MPSFRLRVRTTEIDLPVGELTVGRATDCFLRIDDDLVSRRHARLLVSDRLVVFEDLGSRNGSKVNGARCNGSVELRIGDTFEIGSQVFQLITGGAVQRDGRDATMTMMPHRACRSCALLIDARLQVCPHCNAVQVPPEPETAPPLQPPTPESATGRSQEMEEMSRAFAASFGLVTGLADKLLALGRTDEAEKMLAPRLREALARRIAGENFDARFSDEALARTVRLATATGRDEWYQWTFLFARHSGRRLDDKTLDDLHARMLVHKPAAGEVLIEYLESQRAEGPDTAQYRRRLEALLRFCR
jgi:pSer/pThr/pTyr-binding forkhead associated (FHA) protein